MKKLKIISVIFWIFAVIASNVMCATIAFNYCHMICSIKYEGFSAPANTAFLFAIPYVISIIICICIAIILQKSNER